MEKIGALYRNIVSLLKIASLLSVILFLPQLFVWNCNYQNSLNTTSYSRDFKLGIETISLNHLHMILGKNPSLCGFGLITNDTCLDQSASLSTQMLLKKGISIKKIYIPINSVEQNDAHIAHPVAYTVDTKKTIPIEHILAYDHTKQHSVFSDVDILMFDMQDTGMKHNGYISSLLFAMRQAQQENKKFIVCDRPNLLGWCMEGPAARSKKVGQTDDIHVPMRHGMTIGELATYFNNHVLKNPVDLYVIPMDNYDRQQQMDQPMLCSLPPALSSIDVCYNYSFLSLLAQVAPFDVGIGTDKAYQCILLPDRLKFSKNKWHEVQLLLQDHGIESKFYRYSNNVKNTNYSGLRLSIKDINRFSSFNTLLAVLTFFKDAGVKLTFSGEFDKIVGSNKVRSLVQGGISQTELAGAVNKELQLFYKKAFNCFLYKPFPKMINV